MNDTSREAFEKWAKLQFWDLQTTNSIDNESYAYTHVRSAWLAWQAAINSMPAVSGEAVGWKLVPIEPTDEMISILGYEPVSDKLLRCVYAELLDAAPTPPDQSARIAELAAEYTKLAGLCKIMLDESKYCEAYDIGVFRYNSTRKEIYNIIAKINDETVDLLV